MLTLLSFYFLAPLPGALDIRANTNVRSCWPRRLLRFPNSDTLQYCASGRTEPGAGLLFCVRTWHRRERLCMRACDCRHRTESPTLRLHEPLRARLALLCREGGSLLCL